jgi:Xaa-Pro dipeptidase
MALEEFIQNIQEQLEEQELDGWLLYDHHGSNRFATEILKLPPELMLTRRFFYWIPQKGYPLKLVHKIEADCLDHLPGKKMIYLSWQELEEQLQKILKGSKKIAMEYSPRNSNPYVSVVDAGTMDVVRETGIEVVSSANLLQHFTTTLDDEQIASHLFAERVLLKTLNRAWDLISAALRANKKIYEHEVQQFILSEFTASNCITEDGPLCAVNEHSALPHYAATKESSKLIQPGDLILIDLWCKQNTPRAIYADLTRVAVAAPEATPLQQEVFNIVRDAQSFGIRFIKERLENNYELLGCEVDQVCRQYIEERGYGANFLHRTGHSIDTHVHGARANLDNLETHDTRKILPGSCFSIEPGIYLPGEFGIRLESDVIVHLDGHLQVTGGIQENFFFLL